MRYAIVSDIHANLQAWRAVMADIDNAGIDSILCLGDVVGYGPRPAEVFDAVYEQCENFVLGNHDAVICDRLDANLFNDTARYVIEWTRNELDQRVGGFFADVPMKMATDEILCVHAEAAMPDRWSYLFEAEDCRESFATTERQLIFVGHTHHPAIFVENQETGGLYGAEPANFDLTPGMRYIVNVGSVGDPRDGNERASYCIYDLTTQTVEFRRVPFDYEAYRRDLRAVELPVTPHFLQCLDAKATSTQTQPIKVAEMRAQVVVQPSGDTSREEPVQIRPRSARRRRKFRTTSRTITTPLLADPPPPRRSNRKAMIVAATAFFFAALFLVFAVYQSRRDQPHQAQAPSVPTTSSEPADVLQDPPSATELTAPETAATTVVQPDPAATSTRPASRTSSRNLLKNASFETVNDTGLPIAWTPKTWKGEATYTTPPGGGLNGSRAAMITSAKGAASNFEQTVAIKPNTKYRLSGWIKSADLHKDSGAGALLAVGNGKVAQSSAVTSSKSWNVVSVDFRSHDDREAQVQLMLGNWDTSRGKVLFDDVELIELGPVPEVPMAKIAAPKHEGVSGQFVRVELSKSKTPLTLTEVQVFSGTDNIAVRGRARQSSTAHGGVADRAIDGNTKGDFQRDQSATHTDSRRGNSWWELDLGSEKPIHQIAVWNRTDGGLSDRLNGAVVRLLTKSRAEVWRAPLTGSPKVQRLKVESGQAVTAAAPKSAPETAAKPAAAKPDIDSILEHLLTRNVGAAVIALKAADDAELAPLREAVSILHKANQTVIDTFVPQIGKTVDVQVRSGHLQLHVLAVAGDRIKGRKLLRRGDMKGGIIQEYRVADLHPQERARRIAAVSPLAARLYFGLGQFYAGDHATAIKVFQSMDSDLGRGLAKRAAELRSSARETVARQAFEAFLEKLRAGSPDDLKAILKTVREREYTPTVQQQIVRAINDYRQAHGASEFGQAQEDFLNDLAATVKKEELPGLIGEYFSSPDWTGRPKVRLDTQIAFSFGNGSPIDGVRNDKFSCRWTGILRPEKSGKYRISVQCDDTAQVWLNGDEILKQGKVGRSSVDLELTAGERYELRAQHFDGGGGAHMKLFWETDGIAMEPIPAECFFYLPGNLAAIKLEAAP